MNTNPPPANDGLAEQMGSGRASVPRDGGHELLPYPSMPVTHTQPAHLAALASLFGIAAPPADRARILELGCASGGNIVPLAVRFPGASFLGVDLSRRHIAEGRARIASLGLGNIRLEQDDLGGIDLSGQRFDYVICHGVFSWVPRSTQEAILRLCRDVLAPCGVATISYNVLPGWHLRTAIRDLCLHYAGTGGTPHQRVARARSALEQIARSSEETAPYGALMRLEAERLKNVPAAYILGEFLSPDNAPCHVRDFIARAEAHGLDHLCEADLFAAVPTTLDPKIRARVTSFDRTRRAANEQDIDFLTGRLFRRSVLARREAGGAGCVPGPDRLQDLHVGSPLHLDAGKGTDGPAAFTDDRARPVTVGHPLVRRAFERLADAYPATLPVAQLTSSLGDEAAGRLRQAIYAMVAAGRATLSTLPLYVGRASREQPRAWGLARAEAASAQPWLTSLTHAGVPAHPLLRALLPHLDGTHDRTFLRERLADALERGEGRGQGRGPTPSTGGDGPPDGETGLGADPSLEPILGYLARRALLEPERDDIGG